MNIDSRPRNPKPKYPADLGAIFAAIVLRTRVVTVSWFLPDADDSEAWRDYARNWMEHPVSLLGFEGDRVSSRIGLIPIDSIRYNSRNRETEDQESCDRDENSKPHKLD